MKRFVLIVLACSVAGCRSKPIGAVDEVHLPVTVEYTERELTFEGAGGVQLVGTLTVPAGSLSKAYPCVLLISGSGPTDRNGSQPNLNVNTMKQIAIGLAGAEIASFRFDKRAVARYAANWPKKAEEIGPYFSWKNHLMDALAAWKRMKAHGLVDPDKCAILGHSEGGMIALSIAAVARPEAIILAATPGRPYPALIHEQLLKGVERGTVSKQLVAKSDQILASIQSSGKVPKDVPADLLALYNPSVGLFLQQASAVEPVKLAKAFVGPILVMNGESDTQVSAERDAKALYAACSTRQNCKLELLPLASHNFKAVNADSDLGLAGPVVPDAIEAINKFLVTKIGGKLPEGQLEVDVD